MKRLLILLMLASPAFGHEYTFYHPNVPAPRIIELDPPQTNTFCASNLTCTVSAAWTFSSNLTVSGTGTFTGALTACQPNSQLYVGTGVTCWAGSDIGAQINTAYAALPSSGGAINIISGSYSFTTPIVMATAGKDVRLVCPSTGATVLTYTPTTGTALTIAGGQGNANEGGIHVENCLLLGSGSGNSTVGVQLGTAGVGVSGAQILNLAIGQPPASANGFGTCLSYSSTGNAFLANTINAHFQGCGTGIAFTSELNSVHGGLIGTNATGATFATAGDVLLNGVSFDDNTTAAMSITNANAFVTCTGCHFENKSGSTESYISMTTGSLKLFGGTIISDNVAGGPSSGFVTASGGSLSVYGTDLCTPGRVITQAFNLSGNVNAVLMPNLLTTSVCIPADISNIYTPGYTGGEVLSYAPVQGTATAPLTLLGNIPTITLTGTEASAQSYSIRENGGQLRLFSGNSGADRAVVQSSGSNALFNAVTGYGLGLSGTAVLISATAPTIAAAGCGGAAAAITAPNGTGSFEVSVGTTPGSACTITMPAATTSWTCDANTVSATTTTNFYVKQTGALSTTSVVLTLFSDVAAATAFQGSDTLRVKCSAN